HPDYPVIARLSADKAPAPVPFWSTGDERQAHGQVIFPTGTYRTVLCGVELHDAYIHGRIVKVHKCLTYCLDKWLVEWTRVWLSILAESRVSQDEAIVQLAKRVLVAIAGKLGEQGRTWETTQPDPIHGPYKAWRVIHEDGSETRHRNVAFIHQVERITAES